MARIRTIKPEFLMNNRSRDTQIWTDPSLPRDGQAFYLYCIAEADAVETGPCKIGIATNIQKRFSSLQGGNWRPLVMCWVIRLRSRVLAREVEGFCLGCLRPSPYSATTDDRLKSEWVSVTPAKALKTVVDRVTVELDGLVLERLASR